ncbi:TniQ family protein [Streptomyces tricolor]|uniref:TniQ family protein n=1 Tax=Streptomyces tricolor TaxID=68277 RepID=UPI003D73CD0D
MRRQSDPLPRSLAPLPGEDLPGFILRLAHRLDLTPVELLRQTGLILPHRHAAPAGLMLMLDGDELTSFCSTTGMPPQDAHSLTFRPYVNRYPPIAEALLGVRGLSSVRARGVFPAWLLTTSTRYCRACLAGDGSPIQQRHGGPWKAQWRMATTFACTEHRLFLRTTCPTCGLPAQMIRGKVRRLIAEPHVGGLHPAQCRNVLDSGREPCGARLDFTDHDSSRPSADLLDLQTRLLQATPYGASRSLDPMAGHNRMTDLLVMASLIRATWPLMANRAPSDSLARALDRDLKRPGPAPSLRISTIAQPRWDTDPFSARGTAALLAIAARTLSQPMPEFRRELGHLTTQMPPLNEPAWGHTWLTLKRDSSPLFQHEVLHAIEQRFPRPLPADVPLPGFLQARRRSYSPEAIPQRLPEEWTKIVTVPLGHSGRSPGNVALRRGLAAHLVQAATGMSLTEAGAYLGIPPAWMNSWGRFRPLEERLHGRRADLPTLFQRFTDHVADQPPVDYHARRKRFANWTLPTSEMKKIVENYPGRRRIIAAGSEKASRIRTGFAALIWSRLTGSEWRLAPDLQPLPAEGVAVVDAAVICSLQGQYADHPFYTYLHNLLPDYVSTILGETDHSP